jgi:hypothetical protein
MNLISKFVALSLAIALSIPSALAAPAKPAGAAAAKSADGKDQNASVLFGSIDGGRLMLEGNIGWPYYPRLGVHYGINDRFSIGGSFGLGGGYAGWWGFGLIFAAPIRFVAWQQDTIAAHFGYSIPLSGSMNIKVGGGVESGATILTGGGLASAGAAIPILLGPAAEIRITKDITIPIESKFGPVIYTYSNAFFSNVWFDFRFLAGITYTL